MTATKEQKTIEALVKEISKTEKNPAKIGTIIRDNHGIPKVKSTGISITKILKENNIPYNTELDNVKKRITNVEAHIKKNKHDYKAKKSLMKKVWLVVNK